MRKRRHFRRIVTFVVFAAHAVSQVITTIAGTVFTFPSQPLPAVNAPLGGASGVATDSKGNVYVADPDNSLVMRIAPAPDGKLTVIAGNGVVGFSGDGGAATSASLSRPVAVAVDSAGGIYIVDAGNGRIRKVSGEMITTIAGNGTSGFSGDGGPAASAQFRAPADVAVDSSGAVYIADSGNNRVRKVFGGTITTVAGSGELDFSGDGGPAIRAGLGVRKLAVDAGGNLYIADYANGRVRKVSGGSITTVAGNGLVGFGSGGTLDDGGLATQTAIGPSGVAIDSLGNIYIVDTNSYRLRKVSVAGIITTIAGNGTNGFAGDGGQATSASLFNPAGVAVDASFNVYEADSGSKRIRKISTGIISTIAGVGGLRFSGDGGAPTSASFAGPAGIAFDSQGNLYIVDKANNRVRKISAGVITTIAGNGAIGFFGDGGPATNASLNNPTGLAVDSLGNLYIADTGNSRIRKVSGGVITTIAGNGTATFSGDGGLATSAALNFPAGVAVDLNGNVYVADTLNRRIRRIAFNRISTIAGTGASGFAGEGGPATSTSFFPSGLAVDSSGTLYIADSFNHRILKFSDGIIASLAGSGESGFSGDGGNTSLAQLNAPLALTVDPTGNIYFADTGNNRVRKIAGFIITTIVGNGRPELSGDAGLAADASLRGPAGVALDSTGNIYISDTGNDRIRKVLKVPPSFQTSTSRLNFSASVGGAPTAAQSFSLSSSVPGLAFSVSSISWLSVTPSSGVMPATIQVTADPSIFSAGTYVGVIRISAPNGSPSTIDVLANLSVGTSLTGKLGLGATSLAFSLAQGASPDTQQLTISNQGSGSIRYTASASTTTGGNWLTISGTTGSVTPVSSAVLNITAAPGTLSAGSYSGIVSVASPDTGEQILVPITLAISSPSQKILLSQVGFTFTAVAQGGRVLSQSLGILNTGSGTLNYNIQATTQSGGSGWLSVSTSSGRVIRPFLDVSFVDVGVDARSLTPATYYGKVTVSATGASNTPQTAVVVLVVLPAGSDPGPDVRPTGLVFTGIAGAAGNPSSQDVTVANLTASAITFGSSITYVGADKGWIQNLPTDFTITPDAPARIVVQPAFTNLSPGPHYAFLTLGFIGGRNSVVTILAVVAPAGTLTGEALKEEDRFAPGVCAPAKLLPQFTQVGISGVTLGFPANIMVKVLDDCGRPMVAGSTEGSVVVSFTNGDLPLSLVSLQDGNWTSTWQPNHTAPTVTLSVEARVPAQNLVGNAQTSSGLLPVGQNRPVLSTGPLSAATGAGEGRFAPGDLILLKGSGLANGPATSKVVPLEQELAGASVVVGGRLASLLYADTGQLIGLVPPDVPLNTSQQIIVQRDNLLGSIVPVIISAAHPAILTRDGSGQGQGLIYKESGSATVLADAANPLRGGDTIVIYCTGLGAIDAMGNSTIRPTVSIGGRAAQVSYAGIALAKNYPPGGAPTLLGVVLSGLGGLFQINAIVPSGLAAGAKFVTINSADQTSQAGVTLVIIGGAVGNVPTITSINTAYGSSEIAQNDFIEIKGSNLGVTIAGPSPLSTQLGGVSVMVNGKPALLYYVSPEQINALTPLDSALGPVSVVVTSNGAPSTPFTANLKTVTPTFLRFGASSNVTATHADGSLIGPSSLGSVFTPARPGETIVTYAVGFGLPSTVLVDGSANQSGSLPTVPICQISGVPITVAFAGLNGFAGLYQLNLSIPTVAPNGDNPVSCTYGGQTTPEGALLSVQR